MESETVICLWGIREDETETWVVWWGDVEVARREIGPAVRVLDWSEFYAAYRHGTSILSEAIDGDEGK